MKTGRAGLYCLARPDATGSFVPLSGRLPIAAVRQLCGIGLPLECPPIDCFNHTPKFLEEQNDDRRPDRVV